jgi:hypothetical protein
MGDQSQIEEMRAAVRGDLERARARRPGLFAGAAVTAPEEPEPEPEREPVRQPEPVAVARTEPGPEHDPAPAPKLEPAPPARTEPRVLRWILGRLRP